MEATIYPVYETLIFNFRGFKVMIDNDLSLLYGVPTKALKQQVKRNIARFPEDFMFELTINEKDELVTNCDRLSFLKDLKLLRINQPAKPNLLNIHLQGDRY